jgi:peptide/nickel transport system permease protein
MFRIGAGHAGIVHVLDVARHLVLPATTLGLFYVAIYARLMRASMLEVYGLDFIVTARAKGLSETAIAWTHALRNALLPVVTLAGVQFGHLLGGSILVETVFNWPGSGGLMNLAIFRRDVPVLSATILVLAGIFVMINLLVDIVQAMIDPRIRR